MSNISKLFSCRKSNSANAATPAQIASEIQCLLPNVRRGTLRFWGVWFGRPYDNVHTIINAAAQGDCLIVHFNEEETLKVWNPRAYQIDSRQFIIGLASRVLWQWYWYGRPHSPGNLMTHDFVRDETEIKFTTTFPIGGDTKPSFNEPAVQIH